MGALVTLLPQLLTVLAPIVLEAYNKKKAELGREPTDADVIAELHAVVALGVAKVDAWDAAHPATPAGPTT